MRFRTTSLPCLVLLAAAASMRVDARPAQRPASAATPHRKPAARPVAEAAAPSNPSGDPNLHELTLPNGLRVFVLERTASPTFAGYFQFGVGGARDPRGRSGIAHLLEHMMFKGTTTVGTLDMARETPMLDRLDALWTALQAELDKGEDPFHPADQARIADLKKQIEDLSAKEKDLIVKNEYDEIMTRAGGVSENASTNNDVTNYFIQLPANRLELWFRLESDRVLHPIFREFYSERDVVHEERRTSTENNAQGLAWEALQSTMFPAHPYGTPVVGWPKDIQRLRRDDARRYFTTYYSPSNCIMVLAGDVKTADVQRLATKYFGAWKRQDVPAMDVTDEPEQAGERRRVVEFDAEPQVMMGWASVREGEADEYPLDVLSSILGGLDSSRLEKTIVQGDSIATSVSAFDETQRYGGAFVVTAEPVEGHAVAELETAIEREIKKVQDGGVSADELERAKIQTEVRRVRQMKSNLGQAFEIGRAVGVAGTPDYVREYERRVDAVTASQVQQAAQKYLRTSRKTVIEVRKVKSERAPPGESEGLVAHQHGGVSGERGEAHSVGFKQAMALADSAKPVTLKVPEIGKDVDRVVLPCGAVVFVKEDHSAPSIDMQLRWTGGSNTTPVAGLAPFEVADDLLTEGGTEQLDPIALKEREEALGMSFSVGLGKTESLAKFWSLSRNFGDSFALAMDVLMRPRLDEKRLGVIKSQYVDQMKRRFDDPGWASWVLRNQVLHGDDPRLGYQASRQEIEAVTPDDVRRLWRRYLGRDNLRITVVGDFDKRDVLDLLEKTFSGWRTAEDRDRKWLTRAPVVKPGIFNVEKDLSAPAVEVVHEIAVDRSAPIEDHAALEILNDILGGSGFTSRLMERVRSDEGLTYGIYSSISHDGRPGVPGGVDIGYETKQQSVAKSIDSVIDEYAKIVRETVSDAEVKEQVDAWRNAFIFKFTNDFYSVARLMGQELDDRPYDYDRQFLDQVQKVTVADVERVARAYLKPENLTICIFGKLTDADSAELAKKFTIKVLPKEEVFRGGYDIAEPASPAARGGTSARFPGEGASQ